MKTVHELAPVFDPEKKSFKSFQEYAEMATKAGLPVLGTGSSKGFSGSVHDPELTVHQLAAAAMVQLFDASQLAPGDMKEKVLGFQGEVRTFMCHYMREAMRIERLRIGLALEGSGHSNAAAFVRSHI